MRLILVFYTLLSGFHSISQILTKPIAPGVIKLKLRKETGFKTTFNFRDVIILDARNDTGSIGYSSEKPAKKYCFANSLANEFHTWVSRYLDTRERDTGDVSLLINIKKLRVSDEVTPKITSYRRLGMPQSGFNAGIIIKFEYYLQRDGFYIPLYRFDSVISLRGTLDKYAATFISIALRSSLTRLSAIKTEEVLPARHNITLSDIRRANDQSFNFPVYTDFIYKKGIYKTFEDFRNNSVDDRAFEFRSGPMGDILYVKENDHEIPLRKVWGFTDGKDLFINSADKYSKLIRVGNTFYFEGIKKLITDLSSGFGESLTSATARLFGIYIHPSEHVNYKLATKYYQVDMENGEVF